MIVFDLQCEKAHGFEAWFASSTAFESQCEAGQVICPFCGSAKIGKAVMAPRIAAKASMSRGSMTPAEAMTKLATMQTELLKDSKWVGSAFAEKARAMADGDAAPATIHGTATPKEAIALREEGISALPLPFPVIPPEKRN
ncbi:DUF1178 family protein [Sphingomonas paeninsulae]|uniref:DUF1178 family protein n=1 Tax=Sphingomonas paeninsulae TaxID=2319844 RepID=A0A494TKR6_SPHPE|nr:DUF1178 family protein [Sphingomonas paeninsulae]AYJ87623.1 DUF1178 family protein [Sphingomonas paeninsulae]